MQFIWYNKNKFLHSVSAIWKCYNCNINPWICMGSTDLWSRWLLREAWSRISIEWSLPSYMPSFNEKDHCKLCSSLFVWYNDQDTQGIPVHGRVRKPWGTFTLFGAAAITRGWRRRSRIFTLHSYLFGVYREAQLESKTGKDTHLLQITEVSVVYLRLWVGHLL